jgi:ribose transport system substrate-binding protein
MKAPPFAAFVSACFLAALSGCGPDAPGGLPADKPSAGSGSAPSAKIPLAFVINNPSDFWTFAKAGIRRAEKEFNVEVDFQVPGGGTAAEQTQIIETLIAKGVHGIAVSVLDPKGAVGILNEAAKRMHVITQDSDCPESNRTAYIGTDNTEAGRVCGREINKALPEGGKVALFVGKLDVANARERRQGILEVLRPGIEVVETFTDEGSRDTAQNNVRNALDKHPDLRALVGLWSYNPPAIVKVVTEKGLAGKVKIIGFDEEKPTLDGIEDGIVESTVVQQPYEFGYRSIRALAMLARSQNPGLPKNGLDYVPVILVSRENIKDFRVKIEALRKEGQ